jgi:hypothetical protein
MRRLLVCVLGMLATACVTGDPSENESESDSETDGESESETETGHDAADPTLLPARGITIVEVEANQATHVSIGRAGGEWVAPDERPTRLLRGRETLVRVHVAVAEGWIPHPVTARLLLGTPEGPAFVRSQTAWIDADSSPGVLGSTFHFSLAASESIPSAHYRVELVEAPEHAQPDLPALDHRTPSAGPRAIGFEDVEMALEVHVVPIQHDDATTLVTPEQLDRIAADLYAVLPVQRVVMTLDTPLVIDASIEDRAQLLDVLVDRREQLGLAPQVHVLGLGDCVTQPECPGGFSSRHADASLAAAAQRIAIIERGASDDVRAWVLQALALNLGRLAPPCPASAGLDPDYPHLDGTIGSWGANPLTLELYAPDSTYDFASACTPSWVSDHGWQALFETIATLSAWD